MPSLDPLPDVALLVDQQGTCAAQDTPNCTVGRAGPELSGRSRGPPATAEHPRADPGRGPRIAGACHPRVRGREPGQSHCARNARPRRARARAPGQRRRQSDARNDRVGSPRAPNAFPTVGQPSQRGSPVCRHTAPDATTPRAATGHRGTAALHGGRRSHAVRRAHQGVAADRFCLRETAEMAIPQVEEDEQAEDRREKAPHGDKRERVE